LMGADMMEGRGVTTTCGNKEHNIHMKHTSQALLCGCRSIAPSFLSLLVGCRKRHPPQSDAQRQRRGPCDGGQTRCGRARDDSATAPPCWVAHTAFARHRTHVAVSWPRLASCAAQPSPVPPPLPLRARRTPRWKQQAHRGRSSMRVVCIVYAPLLESKAHCSNDRRKQRGAEAKTSQRG
jgi:hypothetical protein